jgi:hypothetical protein
MKAVFIIRLFWTSAAALLLSSCAHLPQITPVSEPMAAEMLKACADLFPRNNWQLLHRIQAELPNGKTETILGLSRIFPRKNTLQCVLLTIEGLVLFEAHDDNGVISVQRALPPFDRRGFARGMLADIRLIFFAPAGTGGMAGVGAKKEKICRYQYPNQDIEEIVLPPRGRKAIRLYDAAEKMRREVLIDPDVGPHNFARKMELTASGFAGYRLKLTLIDAEPIQ